MKKKEYIQPEAEIVYIRLQGSLLQDRIDDLFGGPSEDREGRGDLWVGAKEQDFDTDETDDIWNMETKDVWER
jgi:hypothetical protein